jgi:DNA-binding SARP family transcriptional activator
VAARASTTGDRASLREPVRRHPTTLEFRILGPFDVLRDGESVDLGGHRQRTLLAILVLSAGQVLGSDVLMDRIWGDQIPPSGSGTLHAYISNLRRALEPERAAREPAQVLVTAHPGYVLNVADDMVDASVFLRTAAEGHRALAAGDARTASETLRAALGLWRGPALANFADEPFAIVDVIRLEEARIQALEDRVAADLLLGRHGELTAELTALVGAHPLREQLRANLMLALYRSGQQSEALEVARAGREHLAEELGLDPHPAIRSLEERILRQDPSLEWNPTESADDTPTGPPPGAPSATPNASTEAAAEQGGILDRESEVGVLDRALRAAAGGAGRVVLVTGEPGIGKTRLVESFAAGLDGVRVCRGQSHDGAGTPPFWPWRQALRDLARDIDDGTLRRAVAGAATTVADVVPELAARLAAAEAAGAAADSATARFQFFDATTRLLTEAGRQDPVLLVLEDLQWSDAPSLELLRFLAGGIRTARVLVVATYRDVGWERDEAMTSTLADLARQPHLERLLLSGITREGVDELMTSIIGQPTGDRLVDAVFARTDGNPLFVAHLARLLAAEAAQPAEVIVRDLVPPGISDLIRWRVAVLPEATRQLLNASSVVGREFELGVLVQVVGASAAEILAVIEPSIRAGLVVETDAPGRFRFTHALIRDAILQSAGPSRVAHLHGQIGDAYAGARTDDLDAAAIAEHYWHAAAVGWVDEAITYALLAADRASVALGHEDEERHLKRALELVTEHPSVSERDGREIELQLRLAKLYMRTRGHGAPEVGAAAARARGLAASLGARSQHLVATWGLVAHNIVRTRHEDALALALEMIEQARETADPVATVAGHQTAGVPLVFLGRPAEAIVHLEPRDAGGLQEPAIDRDGHVTVLAPADQRDRSEVGHGGSSCGGFTVGAGH